MASVRRWEELVDEGRQLKIMEERVDAEHGNIRWQWGDLALEVAPMGERGQDNGATERLRQFAEELDVSFESLRQYRNVAATWPNGMRVPFQPWVCHQILAAKKYEDIREDVIANPVEVTTGEKRERWTQRMLQRKLGHAESPVHRKAPQTSAEKLAEINDMVATVGDDEAVEFIDGVVEVLEALEQRTERAPSDHPEPSLPERWEKAIAQLDRVLTNLAKLNNETDNTGITLTGHAAAARYLYERIAEKKLDAEIRQFLESEEMA